MREKNRTAFTLLELLVVIGLVLAIAAIIVPTLGRARQRASVAECGSQMRQLQVAHWSYAVEHDGRLIDAGLPHGGTGNPEVAWINTLEPLLSSSRGLQSPLDSSPHWSKDVGGDGVPVAGTTDRFRRTSYGLNNYLTQYSPAADETGNPYANARVLTDVPRPANTVHFLIMVFEDDDGFAGADHVHVENWRIDPPRLAAAQMQTNATDGEAGNPDARSNYGFLDGHVEELMFSEVYATPSFGAPGAEDRNSFNPAVAGLYRGG